MRAYFASLGQSAHPHTQDPQLRQVSKFQELLVVAFREFGIITDELIANERKRFKTDVVESIETFAKRAQLRNLKFSGRFDKVQLSRIFDNYQLSILKVKEQKAKLAEANGLYPGSPKAGRSPSIAGSQLHVDDEDRPEVRIDRETFGFFLAEVATWAGDTFVVKTGFHESKQIRVAEHEMIGKMLLHFGIQGGCNELNYIVDRMFFSWDTDSRGALSFQDIVRGLDAAMFNDLMGNITWLFTLHDNNKDGYLTKDEVLKVSESLLVGLLPSSQQTLLSLCQQFIFRNEPGDQYLAAVSRLMQNSFEFAEERPPPAIPAEAAAAVAAVEMTQANGDDPFNRQVGNLMDEDDSVKAPSSRRSTITEHPMTVPFLSLAIFRMVVMADELLESFFSEDLTQCWHLEPLTEDIPPPQATGAKGLFTNLVSSLMTDENKEYLGKLADDIGKRLDIQQVEQKPSLGRLTGAAAMQEPQERATLFSTSKSKGGKSPSPLASPSPFSAASMRLPVSSISPILSTSPLPSPALPSPTALTAVTPISVTTAAENEIVQKALPTAPKDKVLGLGIMDERPRFAIDRAVEDEEVEEGVNMDDDAALLNGEHRFSGKTGSRG